MKFVSIDEKKKRKSTEIIGICAGIACIGIGIYLKSIYWPIIGIVLLFALSLRKEIYLDERGLVVEHTLLGIKHMDIWDFEDIQEVHTEISPDRRRCAIHVMKDVMSRRLVYDNREIADVLAFIRKNNPKVHIAEVDK